MMMRPRSYSVLNRSIARGISYALRDSNRKKYTKNNSNTYNQNLSTNPNNIKKPDEAAIIMGWVILFILIILPCMVPEILILYLLGFILMCIV